MRVILRPLIKKGVDVVVEIVKSEAKLAVHDLIHNIYVDYIRDKLLNWRWVLLDWITELIGKFYIIPKFRKIIRYQRAMGIPVHNPIKMGPDFRYHAPDLSDPNWMYN